VSVGFEVVSGGDRRPPDEGDVDAVAQELFEVAGNAPADWFAIREDAAGDLWRRVARHVLVQRFAACHLAEKIQQLFEGLGKRIGSGGPAYTEVAAVEDAVLAYWAVAPHDRTDCPCVHPPGTAGRCGVCNCADEDPS
jgi:hypothetical protein